MIEEEMTEEEMIVQRLTQFYEEHKNKEGVVNMKEPDMLFGHELVYKIDKENGTTVCYFKGSSQSDIWSDIVHETLPRLTNDDSTIRYAVYLSSSVINEYPKKFGKTKLHHEDTWDDTIGRHNAKAQLRNRINRAKRNALIKWSNHFWKKHVAYERQCGTLIDKLNNSINKYNNGDNLL